LKTTFHPTGTADRCPNGPVDVPAPRYVVVTSQAITPISERETIYYYSGGQLRQHADELLVDAQIKAFTTAFLEDKSIIEAQQKVVDMTSGQSMMTLRFDRSTAMFRRLMTDLIEQEAAVHKDPNGGRMAVAE
jgi:hypothetical protein